MKPGTIQPSQTAAYVTSQDVSGDPSALTDASISLDKRIDWVFGRGVSFTNTEVLADALSSDHVPLVVLFTLALRSHCSV
jgi:endonuclease/exonuclease/phosphatase (EEP) superfamily protein YafD